MVAICDQVYSYHGVYVQVYSSYDAVCMQVYSYDGAGI